MSHRELRHGIGGETGESVPRAASDQHHSGGADLYELAAEEIAAIVLRRRIDVHDLLYLCGGGQPVLREDQSCRLGRYRAGHVDSVVGHDF